MGASINPRRMTTSSSFRPLQQAPSLTEAAVLAATAGLKRGRRQMLPAPAPTAPGSGSPTASASNEPENQEQQHRADGSVDNRVDESNAKMDAELRQQPASDESSYDSDYEVPDNPVSGSLYDLTGQPSRNEANHECDEETLTRHVLLPAPDRLRRCAPIRKRHTLPLPTGMIRSAPTAKEGSYPRLLTGRESGVG